MNSMVYVALLRGINVGGKSIVSMADLVQCFEALGFRDVKTYINSGNVLFAASNTDARYLENTIEAALERTFSFPITVVVRTGKEISQLLAHVPAQWTDNSDYKCDVLFLRHEVDNPAIANDFIVKPEIETFSYQPGALLWRVQRPASTRSAILRINSKPLYKQVTIRNINTVRKINELLQTWPPKK